jgi:hypothetical protein
MVDEKFSSITELYKRVLPALRSKKKELIIQKIGFITEKDIWDFLRDTKWSKETNLTLFDIVNDILNVEQNKLFEYISNKK